MIDLTAYRLKRKSTQENHSFSPLNIKGLDKALQTPVAVFEYARSGNNDMQNVIVDITQNEKHFLAGISFNKKIGFEVSNIRGLFPKDDYQWLHWVEQGKMIYGNKEKIQALSTQRRIDLADVSNQDARISSDIHCLDSIDTILGKFGSVNDIFTQEFSFYAQQKELYSIYRKIHASFAWDAVYEDDARFYAEKIFKAIHGTRETEKIMDEGIENMQANGGRSQAAMEADYEYEQFSSPETEETEEESFGFENFTEEALLHLAEISPEAYESLKKEYEQRTGLPADEYLKKSGDKERQEKEESHIAQRLKSLLENQEMTVQELAVKAGVTEAAILRYINGERIPRGAILLNVANALGVSAGQITGKDFPFTSSYGGEKDFLEAVQAIHPELVNTVVEKNPPEQKPDTATSFVLEKLKSAGIEVIANKNEFEKILHKETLLQKSMKQLSSDEINAYFSFNKDDIERFNKSLDDWEKNKMNPFRLIQVGKIPPVMKALGIADEPVEIQNSTIMKILRPEPRYPYESQGHNLTMDDVRAIPKLLADPVMVFTSRTREDSYVFFTERKDSENRSIIIPIAVNKRKGRIIINEITSMYGRNNEFEFVHSSIETGNLVYMDKKRTEEWEKKISSAGSRAFRKQYPGERATKLTEPSISILTKERLVNFISSRQMMISDGTTYGFAYNGKIYLNPDFLNSNVAVHEYTHLWDKYIQNTNPELWERGKEAFKKTSLWEQVKSDPSYTDIAGDEDLVLSECHARICGEIAQSVLEKIAREDGRIAKDTVIDWDKETWTYIAQNFTRDIASFIEVKDFMNLPIRDLMNEKIISYEQAAPAKEKYKYDENDEQTRYNNLLVYNFMFDSDNDSDYYGAIKLNDKFNFSEFADFHLMNAVETFNEQIEFNKKKEKKL